MTEPTTSSESASAVCSIETFLEQKYDYLVIGGGAAGLAVAARLTENPNVTVGVLEAGADRRGDMKIDCPVMFSSTFNDPDYDWQYKSTPQEGHNGAEHHFLRGKVLGGSSAINFMTYIRGSEQDYDNWAALVGDDSWSWKNLKGYMKKQETLEPLDESLTDRSNTLFLPENHGTSGPIRTSFSDSYLPIEEHIYKACYEVTGIPKSEDSWNGNHLGFYNTLGSITRTGQDRGKRSYATSGYLGESHGRPNLKVLCEALVASVDFDGTVAKGVTFSHQGAQHSISASREVIVCGGAINSPQILELSGIGDPAVLKAAGVECKVELPAVGNHFQDHSLTAASYELAPGNISLDSMFQNPEAMAKAQADLIEKQAGPLTANTPCQGFFPYKLFATDDELKETVESIRETADASSSPFEKKQLEQIIEFLKSPTSASIQYIFMPGSANFAGAVEDQSLLFKPPPEPTTTVGVGMGIALAYPVSRGSVHITSADPTKPPAIDPAYTKHPADTAVLAAGLKFVDRVAKSKALEGKVVKRRFPSDTLDLQQTQDGMQAVRNVVLGEYHPCGSCAMGEVVDSRLQVKGVRNLRVVDASVFPNHVSGNIISSVYAVAEKAADMIKEDWNNA